MDPYVIGVLVAFLIIFIVAVVIIFTKRKKIENSNAIIPSGEVDKIKGTNAKKELELVDVLYYYQANGQNDTWMLVFKDKTDNKLYSFYNINGVNGDNRSYTNVYVFNNNINWINTFDFNPLNINIRKGRLINYGEVANCYITSEKGLVKDLQSFSDIKLKDNKSVGPVVLEKEATSVSMLHANPEVDAEILKEATVVYGVADFKE